MTFRTMEKHAPRGLAMLAALALTTVAVAADATPLAPGGSVDPQGTSPAVDPQIKGPVTDQVLYPFDCNNFHGQVLGYIVTNALGESDIYFTILNDSMSTSSITKVTIEDYGIVANLDVGWRTDWPGIVQPQTATRDIGGHVITFGFAGTPVSPGTLTMYLMARTRRHGYNGGGTLTVSDGASTCAITHVFQPM